LDDEIKSKYQDLEWRLAKDMRNFLIHEYFKVDFKAVWDNINIDLPILKRQIGGILESIRKD
jgi:uncharacterized protein with HEPN domain